MKKRPHILTIAGFDPSGGAGLLADIKTFERNKCMGMAVQTANTIQTESQFVAPHWIKKEIVIEQLTTLLSTYRFNYVKIGLISDLELLKILIGKCLKSNSSAKIIWDPVLSISAGYDINHNLELLSEILEMCYLVTPNYDEIAKLVENHTGENGGIALSKYCHILLKGGHNLKDIGTDYLFSSGQKTVFKPKKTNVSQKHGSGCIFASAITANLALNYPLKKAILRSKTYIEKAMGSNHSLLSHHQ